MIREAIDHLRYAPATFWRCVAVCGVAFAVLWSLAAQARDPDGRYAGSEHEHWFKSQHNEQGQWCCDKSDGHRFDGDYTVNGDGSVTAFDGGQKYQIPAYMVLKGANPTGGAVWWFVETAGGRMSFCFAPGSLT